jgi:DNA adenine methylase
MKNNILFKNKQLCVQVIKQFPDNYENYDYLEPFVGFGVLLLNKPKSTKLEVIGDHNTNMVQIFRTLRDEPKLFIKKIKSLTYSENVFNKAKIVSNDCLDQAVNDFVLIKMSKNGFKETFSTGDLKNGKKMWKESTNSFDEAAVRLKEVRILNKTAYETINAFSEDNVLLYADPPCLVDVKNDICTNEMSADQHIKLAEALNKFRGKAIITGQSSTLYNRLYKEWKKIELSCGDAKKTNTLWKNY